MNSAEKHYFELLQAAIWDHPVRIDEKIDWASVMQIAKHHTTETLICGAASSMTGDNKPNPSLLNKMKDIMRRNLLSQLKMKQSLITAVTMLREHQIEPILLKGFGLAQFYPNPNLRQFGDIDLFVGLERFHEACDIMKHFPGSYNWGVILDSGRHFVIELGDHCIETHRVSSEITDPKEYDIYMNIEHEGLVEHPQRINFEGFELSIPSKEFMVFFTFHHAWHHFMTTGVGWRQLCDISLALHAYHNQLDATKLVGYVKAMQLMKPWQTFGYLMVNSLGLPEVEFPNYDASCRRRARKLYKCIMKEGNFKRNLSFNQHRPKNYWLRKIHTFICVFIEFFKQAKVFPNIAFKELVKGLKMGFRKVSNENKQKK